MFQGPLSESLLKKAQEKGLIVFNLVNIRDFTTDKHKTADDSPYGGGAGMVMKVDVIAKAIENTKKNSELLPAGRHGRTPNSEHRTILLCPTGKLLTQEKVLEFSKLKNLTLICGHYEGIDERVRELVDEEISIGDYVLTGGELPAMILIDAVARHIPGVVKEEESVRQDSFYEGLLDHPSYTKPEEFEGKKIPEVLTSGHHKDIERWRRKESLRKTLYQRPDLLAKFTPSAEDRSLLNEIIQND